MPQGKGARQQSQAATVASHEADGKTMQMQEDKRMLNISYVTDYGSRGAMSIDLEALLPCSKSDFRWLIDTINHSDDVAGHSRTVYEHIAGKVSALKMSRKACDSNSPDGKTKTAKINAEMKRYLGLADMLVKIYQFEPITDANAQTSLKSAVVYALTSDNGHMGISVFDGWTFEKSGYTFDVYKKVFSKKLSCYYILLHGTGSKVAECSTRSGVIAEISPRLLASLAANAASIEKAQKEFTKYMGAAGYTGRDSSNKTNNTQTGREKTMKNANSSTHNNYFAGVKSLEGLRTVYKNLLKQNHPDNGGDVGIMQEINAQYDKAFQALKAGAKMEDEKDALKWSDAQDAALREALFKIVYLAGLNIELVGCWIWVDGNTYPHKDALKKAGYKWSKARQKWHFSPYESKWHKGGKKSFDQLRQDYGSSEVENEERRAIA